MLDTLDLPLTICFCLSEGRILLVQRAKDPNKGKWNGIGGKIEPGESPEDAIHRECLEETGIDLNEATELYHAGAVTWEGAKDPRYDNKGMHLFIARLPEHLLFPERDTREGLLVWHPLNVALDFNNADLTENVPYILPRALAQISRARYHCHYRDQQLVRFTIEPLDHEHLHAPLENL